MDTIILVLKTSIECKQCALTQTIIYKFNPLIIMVINSVIVNINGYMYINIVLWICKPSKQTCSSNDKVTTQHLKLIIPNIQELYVNFITKVYQSYRYKVNLLYKILCKTKVVEMNSSQGYGNLILILIYWTDIQTTKQ